MLPTVTRLSRLLPVTTQCCHLRVANHGHHHSYHHHYHYHAHSPSTPALTVCSPSTSPNTTTHLQHVNTHILKTILHIYIACTSIPTPDSKYMAYTCTWAQYKHTYNFFTHTLTHILYCTQYLHNSHIHEFTHALHRILACTV